MAEPAPDEWPVYVHPVKKGMVPVNPDWPTFYVDDAVFNSLRRSMGVTRTRLLRLLSSH